MLAMKIQPAPRTVAARIGMAWLTEGFRLFHRQPLIWFLTLFAYWAGLVILAMVPLLGLVAPLILTPGLGFCCACLRGRSPRDAHALVARIGFS
ncbi:MAG: hypothetical protein ACO35I_03270 [Burkholderiaceae bacterium]